MNELSTSQKGAAAEAEIAAAAIQLDLVALRPLGDGAVKVRWADYEMEDSILRPWASRAPSDAAIGSDLSEPLKAIR
jgi:hypothetical protein